MKKHFENEIQLLENIEALGQLAQFQLVAMLVEHSPSEKDAHKFYNECHKLLQSHKRGHQSLHKIRSILNDFVARKSWMSQLQWEVLAHMTSLQGCIARLEGREQMGETQEQVQADAEAGAASSREPDRDSGLAAARAGLRPTGAGGGGLPGSAKPNFQELEIKNVEEVIRQKRQHALFVAPLKEVPLGQMPGDGPPPPPPHPHQHPQGAAGTGAGVNTLPSASLHSSVGRQLSQHLYQQQQQQQQPQGHRLGLGKHGVPPPPQSTTGSGYGIGLHAPSPSVGSAYGSGTAAFLVNSPGPSTIPRDSANARRNQRSVPAQGGTLTSPRLTHAPSDPGSLGFSASSGPAVNLAGVPVTEQDTAETNLDFSSKHGLSTCDDAVDVRRSYSEDNPVPRDLDPESSSNFQDCLGSENSSMELFALSRKDPIVSEHQLVESPPSLPEGVLDSVVDQRRFFEGLQTPSADFLVGSNFETESNSPSPRTSRPVSSLPTHLHLPDAFSLSNGTAGSTLMQANSSGGASAFAGQPAFGSAPPSTGFQIVPGPVSTPAYFVPGCVLATLAVSVVAASACALKNSLQMMAANAQSIGVTRVRHVQRAHSGAAARCGVSSSRGAAGRRRRGYHGTSSWAAEEERSDDTSRSGASFGDGGGGGTHAPPRTRRPYDGHASSKKEATMKQERVRGDPGGNEARGGHDGGDGKGIARRRPSGRRRGPSRHSENARFAAEDAAADMGDEAAADHDDTAATWKWRDRGEGADAAVAVDVRRESATANQSGRPGVSGRSARASVSSSRSDEDAEEDLDSRVIEFDASLEVRRQLSEARSMVREIHHRAVVALCQSKVRLPPPGESGAAAASVDHGVSGVLSASEAGHDASSSHRGDARGQKMGGSLRHRGDAPVPWLSRMGLNLSSSSSSAAAAATGSLGLPLAAPLPDPLPDPPPFVAGYSDRASPYLLKAKSGRFCPPPLDDEGRYGGRVSGVDVDYDVDGSDVDYGDDDERGDGEGDRTSLKDLDVIRARHRLEVGLLRSELAAERARCLEVAALLRAREQDVAAASELLRIALVTSGVPAAAGD